MTDKIVVLTTCDSQEKASGIARHLIDKRVAACVNIVPGARSVYRWKGEIEETSEWMLLIKSRRDLFDTLVAALRSVHPYDVPEIVALPVVEGGRSYLDWIDESLTHSPQQVSD